MGEGSAVQGSVTGYGCPAEAFEAVEHYTRTGEGAGVLRYVAARVRATTCGGHGKAARLREAAARLEAEAARLEEGQEAMRAEEARLREERGALEVLAERLSARLGSVEEAGPLVEREAAVLSAATRAKVLALVLARWEARSEEAYTLGVAFESEAAEAFGFRVVSLPAGEHVGELACAVYVRGRLVWVGEEGGAQAGPRTYWQSSEYAGEEVAARCREAACMAADLAFPRERGVEVSERA